MKITRMKTRTIKTHALDWLNERGRILPGAIQPHKNAFSYRRYRFRYRCSVTWPLFS